MVKKQNIILFGYGSFGRQVYKNLLSSGYNIRVVCSTQEHIEYGVSNNINITKLDIKKNDDIKALHIDEKNDLLYCTMNKTANNLFLILTLRTIYQNANIIAISNSFENTRKLKYAGANSVIDLYEATSRQIVNYLTKPAVTKALNEIVYNQNDLNLAEITLQKQSFLDGAFLTDIDFKSMGIILIAIIDLELGNKLTFANHNINHKLDAGDVLVVLAKKNDLQNFKNRLLS
jgi:voltage-gated potassium channel